MSSEATPAASRAANKRGAEGQPVGRLTTRSSGLKLLGYIGCFLGLLATSAGARFFVSWRWERRSNLTVNAGLRWDITEWRTRLTIAPRFRGDTAMGKSDVWGSRAYHGGTHTFERRLNFNPHFHILVSAGGLQEAEGWLG